MLLVVLAPLIGVLMILVRLTSRGPALYRQPRLGLHNRVFLVYKLRTMCVDAEARTGPTWATPNDPRVTPLGRVLRATHLDELPQLWNVIRGQMSLVGPRPERPEIVLKYEKALPEYRQRTIVRPGVTGLAQIQQAADSTLADARRKIAYDLHYVAHANLWLDLRILVGTALKVAGVDFESIQRLLSLPDPCSIHGTPAPAVSHHEEAPLAPHLAEALS